MKATKRSVLPHLTTFSLTALMLAGCGSPVVRENILSTVNSGVGLNVTPNPQTQMPEVKIGYIRNQFYSVPTGKKVRGKHDADGDGYTTDASVTPELVSGIRVKSGIEQLLIGFEVSESFAVGKEAVQSDAATAMYIADARSEKRAQHAAEAVSQESKAFAKQRVERIGKASDELITKIYPSGDKPDEAVLKKALQGTTLDFDQVKTLDKATFERKLRTRWHDQAEQMQSNLKK